MTEVQKLQGRCMCGAVTFSATSKEPSVVACHCDMCRRWSAGPFMSLNCDSMNFDAPGRHRSASILRSLPEVKHECAPHLRTGNTGWKAFA